LEAVEVEHRPVGDRGGLEQAEPVREPCVVDVEDGAVVASFAADADFGFATACARGDVDGADAERLADPESAPLIAFTRMLEDHWLGVIRWHHSKVSTGLLEGLNSLIQAAKRRARGYRSNRNFITMIYLIAGKLNAGPSTA
jgi:hypothetical protein